ncbi:MAG: 2-phosphosulfolactate phosphatase [Gemmatimonadota bacterium]|nr:2-phosphosulfolactate phosphatase [Gemmatimonadota bacterium]
MIDVLRASTTIVTALANGARAVLPFADTDELMTRARQFERRDVRLAGERRMLPIDGFDLGNSPAQFTTAAVGGMTVLMTTTNGTRALVAAQGAADIVVAAYVNISAVTAMLRAALRAGTSVVLACAGQDGHYALEDAACAGRLVRSITRRLSGVPMNDAAHSCALLARSYGDGIAAVFHDAAHGRALSAAGFLDDLALCATLDAHPIVPVFNERQITRLGAERER